MGTRGLTLVEILIAIVVFAVGVLATASTGALVTRALADGRRMTTAALAGSSRIERLRHIAQATDPRCSALAGGSATSQGWILERWSVTSMRRLRVVITTVTYRGPRGVRTDSIATVIACL